MQSSCLTLKNNCGPPAVSSFHGSAAVKFFPLNSEIHGTLFLLIQSWYSLQPFNLQQKNLEWHFLKLDFLLRLNNGRQFILVISESKHKILCKHACKILLCILITGSYFPLLFRPMWHLFNVVCFSRLTPAVFHSKWEQNLVHSWHTTLAYLEKWCFVQFV